MKSYFIECNVKTVRISNSLSIYYCQTYYLIANEINSSVGSVN